MLASPQTLDPKAPSTLRKAIEDLLEQLDQLGKGKLGTSCLLYTSDAADDW